MRRCTSRRSGPCRSYQLSSQPAASASRKNLGRSLSVALDNHEVVRDRSGRFGEINLCNTGPVGSYRIGAGYVETVEAPGAAGSRIFTRRVRDDLQFQSTTAVEGYRAQAGDVAGVVDVGVAPLEAA